MVMHRVSTNEKWTITGMENGGMLCSYGDIIALSLDLYKHAQTNHVKDRLLGPFCNERPVL